MGWKWMLVSVVTLTALRATVIAEDALEEIMTPRCFPQGFLFGSATAAYQVEGGWNATGRTPSIWDEFCRINSTSARPLACANVADDFLHRYEQDIDLMAQMGLGSFRFSISWSRVMTWHDEEQKMVRNRDGVKFYHAMIDALHRRQITPIVTLYHWDLPAALHHHLSPPGWLSSEIVSHFKQYAELVFQEYGTKVDFWSTFNEPWTFTTQGYGNGLAAPGWNASATNVYRVAHHVLLAHAAAVARFRELRAQNIVHPGGRVGMVLNADFAYPLNASDPGDVDAANRKIHFVLGWFLSPLVNGDYPRIMRERVGDRLPLFNESEAELVKGSYDVFMLNHYSSKVVTDCSSPASVIRCHKLALGWERDLGIDETRAPPGSRLSSTDENGEHNCNWFTGYPRGYRDTIKWMHAQDPSAPILLTENGWCGNETIENEDQLWYFETYLDQVHKAITRDKIPIIGYSAWSFMDNYEWGSFKPRFGLIYVNYPPQTGSHDGYRPQPHDLKRIPRLAARWYAQVATKGCLDTHHEHTLPRSLQQQVQTSKLLSNLLVSVVFAPIAVAIIIMASRFTKRRLQREMATDRPVSPHKVFNHTTYDETSPLLGSPRT